MKKIFLFSIGLFLILSEIQAQDLIVTSSGDSINCTITKIKDGYVHFTFKHNNEVRNTLLPLNQIIVQQKNYFSEPEIPKSYVFKAKFPRFRVAVNGGWQYRTAKLPSGIDPLLREHIKKLKSGFHYDVQAAYFFASHHGIEVTFSQHFFGNSLKDMALTDEHGKILEYGTLKEKNILNYAGANYIVRFFNAKKKNCFLITMGLGYLGYIDKMIFNNKEYLKITAATLGVNLGLGYDIEVAKNLSVGFKFSFMGGSFRNYKLKANGITTNETMPEKTSEGLGTIKLAVGLRFNK